MKIEIKHRWTDSIMFEYDVVGNSIAITLKAAIEARADLRDADLSDADLSGAYLRGAHLSNAEPITDKQRK